MKKKFFYTFIIISLFLAILSYVSAPLIKKNLSPKYKQIIKNYVLPFKVINEKNLKIYDQELKYREAMLKNDLVLKKFLFDIHFFNDQSLIDLGFADLKIYSSEPQILAGIQNPEPGSAYIEYYQDELYLLSSIGIFAKAKIENENLVFKQIENNIGKFINEKQFRKTDKISARFQNSWPYGIWFSIKDLKIFNERVYVSFTDEIKEDCWNTSVIFANLNDEKLDFKYIFKPKDCANAISNEDNEFNAFQSGGRIVDYDENSILLSVGDYRLRSNAQNKNSSLGKILKINLNGEFKPISMGHRNPQGLLIDKTNKFVLATEHGPRGGDEINLINLETNSLPNYGWPISSYGTHYTSTAKKIKKYPLHKSHKDHGFIEPLKYFTPSIGISEILKIGDNTFFGTALKGSMYKFDIQNNSEIVNFSSVKIPQRIRDATLKNEKEIFIFLETSASIGLLRLK